VLQYVTAEVTESHEVTTLGPRHSSRGLDELPQQPIGLWVQARHIEQGIVGCLVVARASVD
jgi:hypothetical protein